MATATTFQPNTDTFGQLTMHATILGEQTFGNLSKETHRDHVNLLIGLVFLITLVVAGIGLYQLDQATFGQPHNQVAAERSIAVDYD